MKLIQCNNVNISLHHTKYALQSGESYGARVTTCYELDYIIASDHGEIISNNTCYTLKSGMLFYRTPGMLVEGIAPYSSWYLQYTAPDIEEVLPEVSFVDNIQNITTIFKYIYDAHIQNSENSYYLLDYYINQLLYMLYTNPICSSNGSPQYLKMEQIKKDLELNWTAIPSLDSMVAMSGYSKSRFCHLFKELYTISPMAYIHKLRIQYVCRLLIETDTPIKEIMLDSGFSNEQIFFRSFKEFTGVTPMAYRISHRILPLQT